MKRFLGAIYFFLALQSFGLAQKPEIIKLPRLQAMLKTKSEKIQVINFWATWCSPCVKEMPIFEKAGNEIKDIKITLVSLDLDLDPSPEKVYRFIERKKLTSTVFLLDETDPNSWIDKIENSWSGALPATLIINTKTGKRKFIERELHPGELEELIDQVKQSIKE